MWHRVGSAPARRDAAGRHDDRRASASRDPARREHIGAHAWVRLPAAPAEAAADLPGPGRAHDLPPGAVPPGGRPAVVGERGTRPPDRRVPRIPVP
jgi:hypothetical protein